MKEREMFFIDVGKMSRKEATEAIGMKWIPWYKDLMFWSILGLFVTPTLLILMNILLD